MLETTQNKQNLVIVWSNAEPEAALQMAFMYARNSMMRGWWEQVRLIIWGPSARSMRNETELQDAVAGLRDAGVELWACKSCADSFGASQYLEHLGFDVRYVGEDLTGMLKNGWTCLTV